MGRVNEFVPDSSVLEAIVNDALLPVLHRCEETFNESLTATLVILANDVPEQTILIRGGRDAGHEKPAGTIRLMFRKTFNPARYRFLIEAIYRNLVACQSGFSGFSIAGEIRHDDGQVIVHTKGGTYRNNVWEWQGWH